MIIIKLKCGLGNQMFQYALGRRLADEWQNEIKFDLSWFSNYNKKDIPRELVINKYQINLESASEMEVRSAFPNKFSVLFEKTKGKYFLNYHYRFNKGLLKKRKRIYLDGYFQSYKYFEPIREKLLAEFRLKDGFSEIGQEIKKNIENSKVPVAIHIRRGDYVTVRGDYNGLCGIDYYKKSIKMLSEKLESLDLFVFSDDIEWAKNNLKLDFPTEFVSRPGLSDAEELMLMSLCKHQIIANSTFSWWAAWLNVNPDKIVITPSRWLAAADIDTTDLIPPGWIKI